MSDSQADAEALLARLRPVSPSAAPGQNMLPPHTRRDVAGKYGVSPVWRAGQGAPALFVHGWDDTHRIWRRFAQDFLQKQRPFVLMDLPGHGASKAEDCSWPFAGQSVSDVCAAEGPVDAIIAHSYGCIASARAIELGATADYFVMIAPPLDRQRNGWAAEARKKGASEELIEAARTLYKMRTGYELDGFDAATALQGFAGKILIIGSDADDECPIGAMHDLAAKLDSAAVHEANGLSHRDLALDMEVYAGILGFLGY